MSITTHIKLNTAALAAIGPELDYLVAKMLNLAVTLFCSTEGSTLCVLSTGEIYSPSTNPAQAWPIIDRLGITLSPHVCENRVVTSWKAYQDWPIIRTGDIQLGPTGLIAAMRFYLDTCLDKQV